MSDHCNPKRLKKVRTWPMVATALTILKGGSRCRCRRSLQKRQQWGVRAHWKQWIRFTRPLVTLHLWKLRLQRKRQWCTFTEEVSKQNRLFRAPKVLYDSLKPVDTVLITTVWLPEASLHRTPPSHQSTVNRFSSCVTWVTASLR